MLFLNYDFWGDESAMDFTPITSDKITKIELQHAMFDELYASKNTKYNMSHIPSVWDYETILHAYFEGTLTAGNINYTIQELVAMRLKRREVNTYDWVTLAEFPIENETSLDISYVDRYAEAGKQYEYSLVAVMTSNVEGSVVSSFVESEFDGIMVAEKDKGYRAFIYDYTPTERNQITSVVTTLANKYPYIIRNSAANYTSGTVHAAFIPLDGCQIAHDYMNDTLYREEFTDFLTNGNPKLIKFDDGRSWIVNIVDNVSQSAASDILYTDFNFVETGNSKSNQDLYNADLITANAYVDFYNGDAPAAISAYSDTAISGYAIGDIEY